MMNYLGYNETDLKEKGGYDTAREISNQPRLWMNVYNLILEKINQIDSFLADFLESSGANIIFTGAGSSSFIGEVLEGPFQKKLKIPCRGVATTDLVTHPENYFLSGRSTLLISFARSGNSPESLHAIKLAEKYCSDFYELNITCNAEGELAIRTESANRLLILLPEESNDKALAMTGSFTSMLLSGILLMHIKQLEKYEPVVEELCRMGGQIIEKNPGIIKDICSENISRVVFLGSGPLYGIARECHLKVQELSDGQVICKYDSYLGFRHGPKAVVDENTLIVYLLSNRNYVGLYERDLIKSVKQTKAGEVSLSIGIEEESDKSSLDYSIEIEDSLHMPDEFLSLPYAVIGQILGFYKSMLLGLSPDSPSVNKSITRVVEGVVIYDEN